MKFNEVVNNYLKTRIVSLSRLNIHSDNKNITLTEQIYKHLISSKFRRHSMTKDYDKHIKQVIENSVNNSLSIPLVWVFGCYKLWRLKEYPFADWSELFFLMHKVDWLKPILDIYKPGVSFDLFADGILVPRLNNVTEASMDDYKRSFIKLLDYVNNQVPPNLKFSLHTLAELYSSRSEFDSEFEANYKKVVEQDRLTPLILSENQKSVIKMNVKSETILNDDEMHNNQLLFEAFVLSSKRRPYYRNENKIFLDSFPINNCLPIGSTRSSTVRFWVGKGFLRKFKETFIEDILSVTQIEKITSQVVTVDGFENLGKNFSSISVIS